MSNGLIFSRKQIDRSTSKSALIRQAQALSARINLPPAKFQPDVSFIIPVYNRIKFTLACIDSIARQETAYTYEIIVGDDASRDETASTIDLIPSVRRIVHTRRLGFLLNCNSIGKHARGRYIAVLNNDVVLFPGWLDAMLGTLSESPEVGLLGSMLLFPDGVLQEAGCVVDTDGLTRRIGVADIPTRSEYQIRRDVPYCSAAAIILPTQLWNLLRGFDVAFAPGYYEDVDLAFRIRRHGLKVQVEPAAKAFHFCNTTFLALFRQEAERALASNRQIFLSRWDAQAIGNAVPDLRMAMSGSIRP
jgi:GT2 family glycosyltransferase